ncbi:S-Ena type endospore appendage [Rummeliibacillus pycnus]|uniref:S-Ena type endospore appendage n=1 Tax=Rummeliibacillus pycnus TaxID=101070 RepID=UPI0037C93868
MAKLGNCNMEFCCVNDEVCLTVELGDLVENVPFVFWTNNTEFRVNGTVVVKNNELGDDEGTTVELVVNGIDSDDPAFIIEPGDTKSFTLDNIQSLALEAESVSGNGENTASISFSLNYKF